MEERRNTLVCSFDHQSPQISALEIHDWIHDVFRASEPTVTMIQIDGPRLQVFIKFVDIQYAHDILQTTQGTAEYKHTTGEVCIVRIEMAGPGTKRVSIANLPPEIHESTLRTHLVPYGEIRTVQDEKWSNVYRYTVASCIHIVNITLIKHISPYLTIVGHRVLVSCDGQPQMC
jgi:hypothetical protein